MLRSILVATDFSVHARRAARRAAMLAQEAGGARLTLMHVAPQSWLSAAQRRRAAATGRRALAAAARELQSATGARFATRLAHGGVVETLERASAAFDLVVVGAHGAHPVRDFAIGTSAERLLRVVRRPLLVVKRPPAAPYRKVLVPVDFSPGSGAALALARDAAPGAALTLLHVYEPPYEDTLQYAGASMDAIEGHRAEARARARRDMVALLRRAGAPQERLSHLLLRGYPPQRIAQVEAQTAADLVAIGKHGKSALRDLLLGSVTLHTLSAARCDVLVVPAGARR